MANHNEIDIELRESINYVSLSKLYQALKSYYYQLYDILHKHEV